MSAFNYEELERHVGHNIVCVRYTDENNVVYNVSLECEDCCEVLLDFDNPETKEL